MRGVGVVDYLALPSRAPSGSAAARSGSAFRSAYVSAEVSSLGGSFDAFGVSANDLVDVAAPARALFPFRKNFFSLVVAGIVGSSSSL